MLIKQFLLLRRVVQKNGPELEFCETNNGIDYGKDSAVKWTVYWRTFFIAVAELFGYNDGEEWMVSRFLFPEEMIVVNSRTTNTLKRKLVHMAENIQLQIFYHSAVFHDYRITKL
ncbi:unnamed protein product [Fraxinus pennsylvanica]|uniref:Uncharacterized protein n=1 Tax=Fraxinus pennsylvanica TaxID=56036 RepID=A0AAD1ZNW4_9LAMI|nr:unnamed protein product [Fraxinus pennsylvanica]